MTRANSGDAEIRRLLRKIAEDPTVEDAQRLVEVLKRRGKHESKKAAREENERTLHEARGIIERDYWEDVQGIVDSIKDAIRSGEIEDEDALHDRIHEEVNGSHRVTYTHAAQEGLIVSQNDGAYFEDFGSEGAADSSGINWSVLMFAALRRDVMEDLGDYDSLVEELRPEPEE